MPNKMARRRRAITMSLLVGVLSSGGGIPRKSYGAAGTLAEQAETHIQKGVELRRLSKDAEALAEFQKAFELAPSARSKAQLGLAEMAVGRFEAAEESLQDVLSNSSGEPWVVAHKAVLSEALDGTRARLGTLNVSGEPSGARVQINGKERCSLPCSVHVQAGEVAVRVLAPGFLPILRTVPVTASKVSSQEFTLVRIGGGGVSDRPEAVTGLSRASIAESPVKASAVGSPWPWVAAGAGVLAAGFGVFEAVQWSRKASDFNNKKDAGGNPLCGESDPSGGAPGCQELLNEGRNARLFAIGGLTLGAGLGVLSWVLFSREQGGDPGTSQARPQAFSCSPALGPNSVVCSARF